MSSKSHFEDSEVEYIKQNWGSTSCAEMAKHLGRSASGVRKKGMSIGLVPRKCRRWTHEEDAILLNSQGTGRSLESVATELQRGTPECSNRARAIGIVSWPWHTNGNRFRDKRGYAIIGFTRKSGKGYSSAVFEHIAVAESALGRKIRKGECVHHINGVKDDNRPENLYLCDSAKHHRQVHNSFDQLLPLLVEKGIVVFNLSLGVYEVA